jgi:hypothetical protein
VWHQLVDHDRDFLRWQLANSRIRVLLLNGSAAVRWMEHAELVPHFEQGLIRYRTGNLRVYRAEVDDLKVFGWNRPLAGPLSADGRAKLSSWLAAALQGNSRVSTPDRLQTRVSRKRVPMTPFQNGYVQAGTVVQGTSALEELLIQWVTESNRATIGEIGAYGGASVVTVRLETDEFVLNRDTKRAAVETFVAAARKAGGAEKLPWRVMRNQRGSVSLVTYRIDDERTPGWYAYFYGAAEPRKLR